MSDDLLPAAKAVEELMPAVEAFTEATGALGPVRELAAWATDLIRYRRIPHQAKLLMAAAERIRASGLPSGAVEDKLLRAVLEHGPLEDHCDMQERWANLLANAATRPAVVRAAFPQVLSELEPHEAWMLDRAFEAVTPGRRAGALVERDNLAMLNLARLGLAREGDDLSGVTVEVILTEWGRSFVRACRVPDPDVEAA